LADLIDAEEHALGRYAIGGLADAGQIAEVVVGVSVVGDIARAGDRRILRSQIGIKVITLIDHHRRRVAGEQALLGLRHARKRVVGNFVIMKIIAVAGVIRIRPELPAAGVVAEVEGF
jgi:hypothetical protein